MIVQYLGVDVYNYSITKNIAKTLNSVSSDSDHIPCVVQGYDARGNGDGKISPTITGDHNSRITDYTTLVCEQKVYAIGNGQADQTGLHKFSGALNCMHDQQAVVISIDRAAFNQGENAKYDIGIDKTGIAQTVVAKGPGAVCYEEKPITLSYASTTGEGRRRERSVGSRKYERNYNLRERPNSFEQEKSFYVVRRLTPLECCRLQGMPDLWCKDVPHSDAQEYKMWGNGMALPNALYIMEGF